MVYLNTKQKYEILWWKIFEAVRQESSIRIETKRSSPQQYEDWRHDLEE
jgi:hypothetical protein